MQTWETFGTAPTQNWNPIYIADCKLAMLFCVCVCVGVGGGGVGGLNP